MKSTNEVLSCFLAGLGAHRPRLLARCQQSLLKTPLGPGPTIKLIKQASSEDVQTVICKQISKHFRP